MCDAGRALEREARADLHATARARQTDVPVFDVAAETHRGPPLRVVQGVEDVDAELEHALAAERDALAEAPVHLDAHRPAEDQRPDTALTVGSRDRLDTGRALRR